MNVPEPNWLPPAGVNEAGELLRRHGRGEPTDPGALASAFDVLDRFRREWEIERNPPNYGVLRTVSNDLTGITHSLFGSDAQVSRRLKRAERIVHKLVRLPKLELSELQDIGGCRVVLRCRERSDIPELLSAVRSHRGFRVVHEDDYVAKPKSDGYRAHHVVVVRDEHRVEIQVRTTNQQLWANAVERIEQTAGRSLRGGSAPPELANSLRVTSEMLAHADRDEAIPVQLAPKLLEALRVIEEWSKLRP